LDESWTKRDCEVQRKTSNYPMPEKDDPTAPADSTDPNRKRVVPRPLHWSNQTDGNGIPLVALYKKLADRIPAR
jgi:hypothetical protein